MNTKDHDEDKIHEIKYRQNEKSDIKIQNTEEKGTNERKKA